MRKLFAAMLLVFTAVSTHAQETRGTIAGTVRDAQGVIPGATAKVTNVDTNVGQSLATNERGYFEAPLLVPGSYRVSVEMTGFKTLNRTGISLAGGQQVVLDLRLEVGAIEESVTVVGEAPLLETNTVRSGASYSDRQLQELPVQGNQPILLARISPGMAARPQLPFLVQGQVTGPSSSATPLGGVGSVEYSIDGQTNNGRDRNMAFSPNADMIQEMRVESNGFTATVGHGVGVSIAMMTRAGTNSPRGTLNYTHWTNKLNGYHSFREEIFEVDPEAKAAFEAGRSHAVSATFGGPIVIPKLVDGRNKLFMFLNYSYDDSYIPGGGSRTHPRDARQLSGDFSDLLLLPNPAQYQIYDPLTTRPDPARPGHVIRDPFPGNIIPANRIVNPLHELLADWLPAPNRNPTSPSQQPINNLYLPAQPYNTNGPVWGGRVDYNASANNRLYFRGSANTFYENNQDWAYQSARGVMERNLKRSHWSGSGTWTFIRGTSVFDGQFGVNNFAEDLKRIRGMDYPPAAVGLPGYMEEFCRARNENACAFPVLNVTGYGTFGSAPGSLSSTTNYQGQFNVSRVKGSHTWRTGVDARLHQKVGDNYGNSSGNFTFNNFYTRKADDTTISPAANLGLSWAAFMLGIPTTAQLDNTTSFDARSPYVGLYIQDTWRIGSSLTLNTGVRYEYENGVRLTNNQMITDFDPGAALTIGPLAEAAYARAPIPQVPVSDFTVAGGPLYATDPGQNGRSWKANSLWMPRVNASWSMNERTILQAGYGLFYDTLNASDFTPNQLGFSATTESAPSVDFGQTWIMGDPARGIAPITNPFPPRAGGNRYVTPLGTSLGADVAVGTPFTAENASREPARVQRVRVGLQRQLGTHMSVEVAYNGIFSDRVNVGIRQDYLPEEYWNSSNVRDITQQNLLNANVTSPFFIDNFAPLRTSDPELYARMATNAFFTSPTTQRHRLMRDYPHNSTGTGLVFANLPLGKTRANSIEASFTRRFANGFSLGANYVGTHLRELTTVHEFDREPWYLAGRSGRPAASPAAQWTRLPALRRGPEVPE